MSGREDLCRRLEAGAKAADRLIDAGGLDDTLGDVLVEVAAALRSEAGLALGRPSLVNLGLVRVADLLAAPAVQVAPLPAEVAPPLVDDAVVCDEPLNPGAGDGIYCVRYVGGDEHADGFHDDGRGHRWPR